ncbi:hypothetical protein KPL71_009407 [Citrus sinensis]|uniref:Uncharacterized protein n=1 Tax=Citrus sinensis TaxID=2711 RepID=A0ACB8MCX3_CITSI|nr:hypothetical protein KPL71_009407 [Citrus sinensis]
MKLLQRSNDSELDDPDKQLSVTEKKIMDACDISNSLDASKDIPSAEGWPISKVAVLLIDSRKENCFLKHNSMTEGVFSLIEKDLDVSSCISEAMSEGKQKRKKIKVTRNFFEDAVNEDTLQQVAFSAVKEATDGKGINQNELIINRSDVAYSLRKEKTMASLQGPLVTKSSGKWTVTQVVDYFHLLPYVGIMSDWLSRYALPGTLLVLYASVILYTEAFIKSTHFLDSLYDPAAPQREVLSNGAKDHQSASGRINVTNSKRTEEPRQPEIHDNQEGSHVGSYIEKLTGSSANTITKSPMQTNKKRLRTNKNGCSINGLSGDFDGPCSVNVDAPPNEEIGNNTDTILTLQINKLELANEEGGDDDLGLKIESLEEDSNGICQGSLAHERICQ